MRIPRILIVEDEAKLLNHLVESMTEEHFEISKCSSYPDLQQIFDSKENQYDVIVMDRLLHGHDSAKLISEIKQKNPYTNILILSAIGTSVEKASVLGLGADDYLSKPFDPAELMARVRVLLRRTTPPLAYANVSLDLESRAMRVDGREIPLTNKEFVLLKTLIEIPGKVFSKAVLYEKVWDMSSDVDSNVIEVTVAKLRGRFKDTEAKISIKNMRNVGYWIEK